MTTRKSSDAYDEANAYELIQDLHAALCDAIEIIRDDLAPGALVDVATILKGARDSAGAWIAEFETEEESP